MIELTATTQAAGKRITVLLLDCSGGIRPERDIMVYTDHSTNERKCIGSHSFSSLGAAMEYCSQTYGLREDDFQPPPTYQKEFAFEFGVTTTGRPQTFPIGMEEGELAIRLSTIEFIHPDDSKESKPQIHVTGTQSGLRRLAAWLLLCADSEELDEGFHIHFEDHPNVVTNVCVQLCGPGYLKAIKERLQK